MKTPIYLALVFLIILSFLFSSYSQAPFAEESPAKAAVREAVFRYMFDHYNYGPEVKVYCIAAERPLPDDFIRRFSQIKPHVVWASDCEKSINGVRDRKTGEVGIEMTIVSIQWIKGEEAVAQVEAFSDGIAANWNALKVVFKENHWKVVRDKVEGVF